MPGSRRGLVRFALATWLLLLASDVAAADVPSEGDIYDGVPDFRIPADSLSGRFHRIGFGPTTDWYLADPRRDSMRAEFENMLGEHLRSAGFEVVDPAVGRFIGQPVVDSLRALIDPRTGIGHHERAAVVRNRVIESLLEEHGVDALLYWGIVGSAVVPQYSIGVTIEDRRGWTVYEHHVELATGVSFNEAFGDHARNAEAVKAVLDPFCEAVFRNAETLDWSRITPFSGCEQMSLPLQILVPGQFSANELPPNPEGRWQALVRSGGQFRMMPVAIRLRSIRNPRATGDLAIPGVAIGSDGPDAALLFLRGPLSPGTKPARTWFVGRVHLAPNEGLTLGGEGSRLWEITGSEPKRWATEEYSVEFRGITVRDLKSGLSQDILGLTSWLAPRVQWVGDLDGDERLDLLTYDQSEEGGSSHWTLYLSSHAERGALFGKAAEFYTPGC